MDHQRNSELPLGKVKRVLFFHQGRLSDINGSVYRGLRARFRKAEVRRVDINKLLKARPWIIAVNLAVAVLVYGWEIVRRKRDLDESFFGTRYIFRRIQKLARQVHDQWPADFSFQTWSMFDCSTPGTPHFVYTDHTYRSSRHYPAYGKHIWAPVRRNWAVALETSIYQNAAVVFTWSHNVTETLIGEYGIAREKVMHVGVGTNLSLPELCQIPTTVDRYRRKNILLVGTRWELKGGPELVAAFQQVRQVHEDATLTIVGASPDVEGCGITITGLVPLDQVGEHLGHASVFCMPTRNEPFGIAFLEALASGLPVVALRQGAAPDFVIPGETGALVEHGDVDGLARAIIELLSNPEKCQRYGEDGRRLVKDKYEWGSVFQKVGERILEVVNSNRNS